MISSSALAAVRRLTRFSGSGRPLSLPTPPQRDEVSRSLDDDQVKSFVKKWYSELDEHAPAREVLAMLADDELEMQLPERTVRGHGEFRSWYDGVTRRFFDEKRKHLQYEEITDDGASTLVKLRLTWGAHFWDARESTNNSHELVKKRLEFVCRDHVRVKRVNGNLVIVSYLAEERVRLPNSAPLPAPSKPAPDALRLAYQEICSSHAGIAEFRAKLLALLPIVSGAGAFVGFEKFSGPQRWLLGPIGLFGIAATLGLFLYELRGIEDCTMLRVRGKQIEAELGIDGQFGLWPPGKLRLVDEIGAGWVVYTAVFASWVLVAAAGFHAATPFWPGYIPAAIVYIGALVIALSKRGAWIEYPGDDVALARGLRRRGGAARHLPSESDVRPDQSFS